MAVAAGMFAVLYASCASIKRVEADAFTDIDGQWNDNDVRIACGDLVAQAASSPRIASFKAERGRMPTVVLGRFKNESTEHIDTSIMAKRFQNAIINSGKMDFVADASERGTLAEEAAYQEEHALDYSDDADGEEVSKLDKETAADFMLLGSVKSIVQREGAVTVRSYFVYAQMMDVERHTIVWSGENSGIKKVIRRKKAKL